MGRVDSCPVFEYRGM